jgi:hypothetical protein
VSEEDQSAIIGKTVTEYAAIRKQLTALLSEAARMGEQFRRWAHYLHPNVEYTNTDLRSEGESPELSRLPTREEVKTIVSETLAAIQAKRVLRSRLVEYGVDLKD